MFLFQIKKIEAVIDACFPKEVVALVSFSSLEGTQIDSKGLIAKFLLSFLIFLK